MVIYSEFKIEVHDMTRTRVPITITTWNIYGCPGKSRTYGAQTHEALMTWIRITMTFLSVSIQNSGHTELFPSLVHLHVTSPLSLHLQLFSPSHPLGLSLNAISLESCSGNLI